MKRSNQFTLAEIIGEMISEYKMKDKLTEVAISDKWELMAGSLIARYTKRIEYKKGTVFVFLDSPALKSELMYHREGIISTLNEFFGKNVVNALVVK